MDCVDYILQFNPLFVARFQLIQRAKSVLTDPETRRFYDAWLQDDMEMSFEEWIQMRQRFRTVGVCQGVRG